MTHIFLNKNYKIFTRRWLPLMWLLSDIYSICFRSFGIQFTSIDQTKFYEELLYCSQPLPTGIMHLEPMVFSMFTGSTYCIHRCLWQMQPSLLELQQVSALDLHVYPSARSLGNPNPLSGQKLNTLVL